ncbi:uncharacterized protein LOC134189103 [Corticium candelabrum]|uniref:uncharacterized protein LOC134189103 n=1 Tax=Corticium candelabrum TaxID=121492 RepID=UPI002E263764|nr:uncharacterized protein LOC134189103 [Corticium candelabrum]
MNVDEKKNPWTRLVEREALLLDQFILTEDLLSVFASENLITKDELDHLRSLHDEKEKTSTLLIDILQYQDPTLFPMFCELLRNDNQQELADSLSSESVESKKKLKPVRFVKRKRSRWDEKYINSLARQLGFTCVLIFVLLVMLVIFDVQP